MTLTPSPLPRCGRGRTRWDHAKSASETMTYFRHRPSKNTAMFALAHESGRGEGVRANAPSTPQSYFASNRT